MGTHARPRRRVRAAALGTLAVGATLTGVGLTAAALDQSGAGLADGTLSTEPVNFAASGLGAPVPVADVSSLDGSSAGNSVVVTKSGSGNGAASNGAASTDAASNDGAATGALLGAPLGGYGSSGRYGDYVRSGKAAAAKPAGTKAAPQTASAASSGASQVEQAKPAVTVPRSNPAPASAGSGGSGSDAASADGVAPKTSAAAASTGSRSASGSASGTSTTPATQFPSLPSLDAHLPISTALPVPSLPNLATATSLTTTVSHAKTTLAGLLDEVAGLV
jgi:hypothetical protein